jgi:hypothetical protein
MSDFVKDSGGRFQVWLFTWESWKSWIVVNHWIDSGGNLMILLWSSKNSILCNFDLPNMNTIQASQNQNHNSMVRVRTPEPWFSTFKLSQNCVLNWLIIINSDCYYYKIYTNQAIAVVGCQGPRVNLEVQIFLQVQNILILWKVTHCMERSPLINNGWVELSTSYLGIWQGEPDTLESWAFRQHLKIYRN